MKEGVQLFSCEGRLRRRPYLIAFIVISILGLIGGYVLRKLLFAIDTSPMMYLQITFMWSLLLLVAFTPFAVRRAHDIGFSGWWVILLWGPPFFDLKFITIVSEYMGTGIVGEIFLPGIIISLSALILLATLFFSPSGKQASVSSEP